MTRSCTQEREEQATARAKGTPTCKSSGETRRAATVTRELWAGNGGTGAGAGRANASAVASAPAAAGHGDPEIWAANDTQQRKADKAAAVAAAGHGDPALWNASHGGGGGNAVATADRNPDPSPNAAAAAPPPRRGGGGAVAAGPDNNSGSGGDPPIPQRRPDPQTQTAEVDRNTAIEAYRNRTPIDSSGGDGGGGRGFFQTIAAGAGSLLGFDTTGWFGGGSSSGGGGNRNGGGNTGGGVVLTGGSSGGEFQGWGPFGWLQRMGITVQGSSSDGESVGDAIRRRSQNRVDEYLRQRNAGQRNQPRPASGSDRPVAPPPREFYAPGTYPREGQSI